MEMRFRRSHIPISLLFCIFILFFTGCQSEADKHETIIREIGELEARHEFGDLAPDKQALFVQNLRKLVERYPVPESLVTDLDSSLFVPLNLSSRHRDLVLEIESVARQDSAARFAFVQENRKALYRLTMLLINEKTRQGALGISDKPFDLSFAAVAALGPILDKMLGGHFLETELASLQNQTPSDLKRKATLQHCWLASFRALHPTPKRALGLLAYGFRKADERKDKRLILDLLTNLQLVLYHYAGRLHLSVLLGDYIIQEADEIGYSRKKSQVHYFNSNALIDLGDYQRALIENRAADTIFKLYDDRYMAAQIEQRFSVIYRHLGAYDLALSHSAASKILAQKYNPSVQHMNMIGEGILYENLGRYQLAKRAFLEGFRSAKSRKEPVIMSVALNNLGNLFFKLADYDSAIICFEQSLEITDDRSILTANTLEFLLNVYVERGDSEKAGLLARRISDLLVEYKSPRLAARYHRKNADLLKLVGDSEDALKSLETALSSYRVMGDILNQYEVLCQIADIHRMQNRPPEAEESLAAAQHLSDEYSGMASSWMIHYYRSLLLIDQKQETRAVAKLDLAIEKLEALASTVWHYELRAGFSNRIRPVYEEMVKLQLRLKDYLKAFEFSEGERAYALRFLLGDSKNKPDNLQSEAGFISQPALNQPAKRWTDLHSLQALLGENDVVLEYEVLDTETVVWIIGKNEIFETVRLKTGRDELRELIQSYRSHFRRDSVKTLTRTRISYIAVQKTAKKLYQKLFSGVESHIESANTIYIISDETLNYLPFAALVLPDDQFLLTRFKIAYAPSAEILYKSLVKSRSKSEDISSSILAIAHDELPFAKAEAEQVAGLFTKATVKMGSEIDKIKLVDLLKDAPKVVLFSTHGKNDDERPANSFLNFRPQMPNIAEESLLKLPDILPLRMKNTEMVYMSACESGTGKLYRGEGTISLQTAFMAANARSIVANMWQVDDESSKRLTVTFFEGWLKQGLSRIEALRQAQLKFIEDIKKGKLHDPHPYFWAAVTLTGVPH